MSHIVRAVAEAGDAGFAPEWLRQIEASSRFHDAQQDQVGTVVGRVMRILEMILPRLETMAQLASDRSVVRDPTSMAELREDYRYMANVCISLLPELEPSLAELPAPCDSGAAIELKVAYQMSLIRQSNRLYGAVNANVVARHVMREERRRRASGNR